MMSMRLGEITELGRDPVRHGIARAPRESSPHSSVASLSSPPYATYRRPVLALFAPSALQSPAGVYIVFCIHTPLARPVFQRPPPVFPLSLGHIHARPTRPGAYPACASPFGIRSQAPATRFARLQTRVTPGHFLQRTPDSRTLHHNAHVTVIQFANALCAVQAPCDVISPKTCQYCRPQAHPGPVQLQCHSRSNDRRVHSSP